jgi:hypothetical protein
MKMANKCHIYIDFPAEAVAEFEQEGGLYKIYKKQTPSGMYSPLCTILDSEWLFKWNFPWWAQIGFAGAKKTCGGADNGARGYLCWELPVKDVIHNLKYIIKVLKNFPISTKLASWTWVSQDLSDLQEVLLWFCTAYELSDKATAALDWGEVALLGMSEAEVRKNNHPNDLMADIKKLRTDIRKLKAGKISLRTFERKYAEKQ